MLRLVLLAPLLMPSLSVDIRDQGDDEFDFDRLPRRPAPIPDDDDPMRGGASPLSPRRVPSRGPLNRGLPRGNAPSRNAPSRNAPSRSAPRLSSPSRDRAQPNREPSLASPPRWQAPLVAGNLPRPPLKYVFAGSRGRFSLIGGSGQAAYQRQRQSFLTGLRYVRRDERFSYWSAAEDASVVQWAFARRAAPDGSHAVWLRTPAGWQYFDQALVSKPR